MMSKATVLIFALALAVCPIAIAVQRRARTTSCRISAAPTVANSGLEKASATTSASGR